MVLTAASGSASVVLRKLPRSTARMALVIRRPIATAVSGSTGAACHEAVRRWVERSISLKTVVKPGMLEHLGQQSAKLPRSGAVEATRSWAASQDLQVARRVFSGIALFFPLFAIPMLEVQSRKIQELELQVQERGEQINELRKEVEAARTTAAVCGVNF
eukprot:TRINITY_DN42474_c0_g1_i1.p1 TRINITY_DN42474_c0_g1~~TRINITY_DN42474_c0_g1_i1.p1  ORF type:complete len:160 (-),score=23.25 TRINITY_DN42474_c0_g1_i1:107-586(-)